MRHKYWSFSHSGDAPYGRWRLDAVAEDWSWKIQPRLRHGSSLEDWPSPPPVFRYSKATVYEDMPWPTDEKDIVSGRLRRFLEREAPGAAEFLPIHLEGPRLEEIPDTYWCINWIRVFDCLDEKASMNVDDEGNRYVEVPVIDPTRIPEDGVLGLLGGYTVIRLIRDDPKRKIQKAGFKGPQFYLIHHRADRSYRPFNKVTWFRKRR